MINLAQNNRIGTLIILVKCDGGGSGRKLLLYYIPKPKTTKNIFTSDFIVIQIW